MSLPPIRKACWKLATLGVLYLALGACVSPIRAVRVDRTEAHQNLTRSAITTGELSWSPRDVLLERGLLDAFGDRPEIAIAELRRAMIAAGGTVPVGRTRLLSVNSITTTPTRP